jgi:lysine 2,3-aminomutase
MVEKGPQTNSKSARNNYMNSNKKALLSHFKNAATKDWQDWRWQFKNRITSIAQLEQIIGKVPDQMSSATSSVYPLAITPYYLSLVQFDAKNDPIRAQCVPDIRELSSSPGALADPLEEDAHMPVDKLVHRYPDRCLAIVTEICAIYCRHCNRKRSWSTSPNISFKTRLAKMLRYISASPQIREVIISGGDPLTFDDSTLEEILASFKAIPHVEVLRIGSRVPIVMPMRITRDLCRILKRYRPLWLNTQFNHRDEITPESARACEMLLAAGIPVSNQSVLLKGVNDTKEVMRNLLYGLQNISVRPYYLFHCDPVKGCEHFRTSIESGIIMMDEIRRQCSGLSLPQYVVDLPGSTAKIPLNVMSGTLKNDFKKHQHFFDKFE